MTDLYVDTPAALADLCDRLRGSPWLALDTEFIRERTYYPRLCLIQVANAAVVACVDPLLLTDLSPLLDVLYDPAITKVLHSAHQDLEIFFHLRRALPGPVFDTQLAATLLGQGEQVGYANLVKHLLNVDLDKSQTRTDWSRRPLQAAQLAYAADDVRYLREVYRSQCAELKRQGRCAWLRDDFAALCDPSRYRADPLDSWRRVKGMQRLRGVQLAVLRDLAAWREEQAMAADLPRRWIAGDNVLLELAQRMPTDEERLKRIRGVDATLLKRHGQSWLAIIDTARAEPATQWPHAPSQQPLRPEQEALIDAMLAVLRLCAAQKGVNLHLLASRKDLEEWLVSGADIPLWHGWRAALAGRQVQALLRGELRLVVRDGGLSLSA